MGLSTTKNISLDFYNNNRVVINAIQYDTESRYINVTCTDYGKKVSLNSSEVSAFIRYKKSDGNDIFNDTTIQDDGTIQILLTQQMLAVTGMQTADLLIVASGNLGIDDISNVDDIFKLGAAVVSTMRFYVNVLPTTVAHENITSTSEYEALVNTMAKVTVITTKEDERQKAEIKREQAEKQRESNCNAAVDKANAAAKKAEDLVNQTGNLSSTIQKANDAADKADAAVAKCEQFSSTVDKVNAITQIEGTAGADYPLFFAKSETPSTGDFKGACYNTGVTLNPDSKTIKTSNVKALNTVVIGDATFTFDSNEDEKKIVISFS